MNKLASASFPGAPPGGWLRHLEHLDQNAALKITVEHHPTLRNGIPREVAILGASDLAETLIDALRLHGTSIIGIYDNDPAKHGRILNGIHIQAFEDLSYLDKDIAIVAATHRLGRAWSALQGVGIRKIIPYPLLNFVEPHSFPGHPFYSGLQESLLDNIDKILRLESLLEDSLSRSVLDAVIGFRLTLDPRVFDDIVTPNPYFAADVLTFGDSEVMIDGGAYDGDTTLLFCEVTGNRFRHVMSVEPSEVPFNDLCRRFKNDKRIRPLKACLYKENSTLFFDTTGSRVSSFADDGIPCNAVSIDSLPEASEITFIKLNIEGAESFALDGARITINNKAPKLAIAVYHKPSDLWMLAEQILLLQPKYKLMLRQHDVGIIETVLYAVPK